jgi:hypothetical protein
MNAATPLGVDLKLTYENVSSLSSIGVLFSANVYTHSYSLNYITSHPGSTPFFMLRQTPFMEVSLHADQEQVQSSSRFQSRTRLCRR